MSPDMEDEPQYWYPFAELLIRDPESLSEDERASLNYFNAADDVTRGLTPNTKARRWAEMARQIGALALELGRMPLADDPNITLEQVDWIERQRRNDLNSYQRANLEAILGWSW
jgi:hypothetical protein